MMWSGLFLALLTAVAMLAGPNDCSPEPEARVALQIYHDNADKTSFADRRKLLDEMAAKYPAVFEIQTERISFYRRQLRNAWPSARELYVKAAEQNPTDPIALTLAGDSLHTTDTPRAIVLLTKAREISPAYPWAALTLAEIYQAGKFSDKDKARANFDAYAGVCADHFSSSANWVMSKVADTQSQAAIAKRLRARLNTESSPDPVDYDLLWSLEFRSTSPAQHPGLRKKVAKDVERLLASKRTDNRFLEVLLSGVKQSGASKEAVTDFENRILKQAPSSSTAYSITYDRWHKDHTEPEDPKDTAAWSLWTRANLTAMKQWATQFPDLTWIEDSYTEDAIDAGDLNEKEGVAAIERSLQKKQLHNGPSAGAYEIAAGELLQKGWAPAKAYDWLEKAWPLDEERDRARLNDDTLTDEKRNEISDGAGYRAYVAVNYLRAMKLAGKKNIPASLRNYLEGPMPANKASWTTRYRALAWLTSVDGRESDALAYFQQALFTHEKAPSFFRGRLEDNLLDEAKAAFLKTGGTEKVFALWSQPSATQQLLEGRWEKPAKTLASFDLSDTSGQTWKLKQLEGKVVLINLWATWCGPCRAELPHFQKLYETTKGRSDIQVISFNVDEDVGLVEPFMKEQGFTFPALIAFNLIRGMFDGYGIPQNWLMDPKGKWIATQIGFDSTDTDWVASMIKRLDAVKQGKSPAGTE